MSQLLHGLLILGVGWALVAVLVAGLIGLRRRALRAYGRDTAEAWSWPYFGATLAAQLVLLGVVAVAAAALDLTLYGQAAWLWSGLLVAALAGGVLPTVLLRRLRFGEAMLALLALAVVAWALAYPRFADQGVAALEVRTLVAGPAAAMLVAAVGGALAYLLHGGGRPDWRWGVEVLVGWRFLRSRKSRALSTVTFISFAGVALGVALLIVALGVLSGFERDIIDKILGANAHLTLTTHPGYTIDDPAAALATARAQPGVRAAYGYVLGEVMIASDTNLAAGMLFGLELDEAAAVIRVFDEIELGSLDCLRPDYVAPTAVDTPALPGMPSAPVRLPGVVIGAELMKVLNVEVGESIRIVSPLQEELTPVGPVPRSRTFRVCAVFNTRMYEYDAKFLYTRLPHGQDFFGTGRAVSGIGLRLDSADASDALGPRVLAAAGGYPRRVFDWKEKNRALVASVKLEKIVAFVVLIFIVLVASFSIINTLTLAVIEKGQAIALLKAMGGRDLAVMKVFVFQGLVIGAVGTLVGGALGTALALLLRRFGLWIDPEVYYIDRLPIHLEGLDVLVVMGASLLITFVAAVYPARLAERFTPVEGLRDG